MAGDGDLAVTGAGNEILNASHRLLHILTKPGLPADSSGFFLKLLEELGGTDPAGRRPFLLRIPLFLSMPGAGAEQGPPDTA